MKKRIMTLMMGALLLLTACGQTRDNSTSTMLPVAAVQSAAQGVAGVADKTADKAEMPQKEEKTEDSADALLPVERVDTPTVMFGSYMSRMGMYYGSNDLISQPSNGLLCGLR